MADLPIEVYGINLLVRLVPEKDAAIQLRCPEGTAMRYAEVVSRGDGFDSDGNVFRAMPHLYAIVAFEEDGDEAPGTLLHGGGRSLPPHYPRSCVASLAAHRVAAKIQVGCYFPARRPQSVAVESGRAPPAVK
jgi:hypothetical protein